MRFDYICGTLQWMAHLWESMKEQHQRLALVTSRDVVKLNAIGFHILMLSIGTVLQDLWWNCMEKNTALSTVGHLMGMSLKFVMRKDCVACAGLDRGVDWRRPNS